MPRPSVKVPTRCWRSYGTDPLPSPAEALREPLAAFPSWFLRIECEHCGKVRMLKEARSLLRSARHADP